MPADVTDALFTDYPETVDRCMSAAGAAALLADGRPVMLKPNLVNASPHPVTTPPALCEAVVTFVRRHTPAPVVIAEGCGDMAMETPEVFAALGYAALSRRLDVPLLDLNHAPLMRRARDDCDVFPEIWLPEAAFTHILISLPVLKAHSYSRITGSMKNMMGLAPPEHYAGGGGWKKAVFHRRMHRSIVELNRYRCPDFTVMDATVGLSDFHLGGPCCDPPVNRILAGADARALDRAAAGLLGMDWRDIAHLNGYES